LLILKYMCFNDKYLEKKLKYFKALEILISPH
jgi:hypothetical protein